MELINRNSSPKLQFEVIDTGLGMTDEQLSHLFQPFTQADTSTTRRFGGTGLGLTISKRLAGILGGDIQIVNTQPGIGTTFRITISTGPLDGVETVKNPITETFHKPKNSLPTDKKKVNSLAGIKILLAEDNPTIQLVISRIVEKAGARVIVVENGQMAFETAINAKNSDSPFDVILMDMQMPIADGYQATKMLRKANFDQPIIALTAHAMSGDRQKCTEAGCDEYLTKPVNRHELIHTINRLVADTPATKPT